ncbi:MAG: hypothetical protein LBL69_02910 [Zoogloeaceae bacterium]|jgi:hypothetical protein|nr:hypothetical protein [Zoogloeaceae bacterium]
MSASAIRVYADLSAAEAARFQKLQQSCGLGPSELLRAALREYQAAHAPASALSRPETLLASYVGCEEGDADLSARYKEYLGEAFRLLTTPPPFALSEVEG